MLNSQGLIDIVGQGISQLNSHGQYENGWGFKPSQEHAIGEFDKFLQDESRSVEDRLTGYFSLPTGIGKTAAFGAMVAESMKAAEQKQEQFRTMIVVPTNQLVDQTKKSLESVSPSLKGKIGLYDGSRKQLKKDVTIITYDSWIALLQEGKISAADTDLLISDEAHRGTSQNRTEEFMQTYIHQRGQHATMCMAFTATDMFDSEKTVERTHKNKIAERTINEAIRDGELAEYAVVKRYIARIPPPEDGRYTTEQKQELKEKYWTTNYLKIMESEVDQMTGDPLYDNISAVYNFNTRHADNTAKALNESEILQEVAKKRGFKNVATSIHTNMSKPENKRRMKDYLNGKYLFATGDSQFKEGLDYPAMKNGADVQRGSQVDKGQIVGRPARRWSNPDKGGRSEGMTFVEIMTYFGHDDPEKNDQARDEMLENSVTASSILEGTAVLANGAKIRDIIYENIDEYELELMQNEAERTGILLPDVIKHISSKNMPAGLNKRVALTLLQGHHFAPMGSAEAILKAYEEQPDYGLKQEFDATVLDGDDIVTLGGPDDLDDEGLGILLDKPTSAFDDDPYVEAFADLDDILILEAQQGALIAATEAEKERRANYEEITDEQISILQAHKKRTRKGMKFVVGQIEPSIEGLTAGTADSLFHGVKSAPKGAYAAILSAFESVPDASSVEVVTAQQRAELKAHAKRTGWGGSKVFNKFLKNSGGEFDVRQAERLISRDAETCPAGAAVAMLAAYQKIPDAVAEEAITDEQVLAVQEHAKRTGKGGYSIYKLLNEPVNGLTTNLAKRFVSLGASTLPVGAYNAILTAYKEQPDAKKSMVRDAEIPMEEITAEQVEDIQQHEKRTGKGGYAVWSLISDEIKGFDRRDASRLISKGATSLPVGAYAALLDAYKGIPTNNAPKKERLSKQQREVLVAHKERTGVAGTAIFSMVGSPVEGFTKKMAESLAYGRRGSAPEGAYSAMLSIYEKLPDGELGAALAMLDEKEVITEKQRSILKSHKARTGVGGAAALNLINPAIKNCTKKQAAHLMSGDLATAPIGVYKKMLAFYEGQPDAKIVDEIEKEAITVEQDAILKAHKERTGKGGVAVFKLIVQPVEDFTQGQAQRMISRRLHEAPKGAYAAMLAVYENLPDAKPDSKLKKAISKAASSSSKSPKAAFKPVAQDDGANDNQPEPVKAKGIGHP